MFGGLVAEHLARNSLLLFFALPVNYNYTNHKLRNYKLLK